MLIFLKLNPLGSNDSHNRLAIHLNYTVALMINYNYDDISPKYIPGNMGTPEFTQYVCIWNKHHENLGTTLNECFIHTQLSVSLCFACFSCGGRL